MVAVFMKLLHLKSYRVSLAIRNHSVTCPRAQVNAPWLNPSHTGQYSIYLPWRDRMLTWLGGWLHIKMVYLCTLYIQSPIQVVIRYGVEQLRWSRPNC